jgi:hypothetical protein
VERGLHLVLATAAVAVFFGFAWHTADAQAAAGDDKVPAAPRDDTAWLQAKLDSGGKLVL